MDLSSIFGTQSYAQSPARETGASYRGSVSPSNAYYSTPSNANNRATKLGGPHPHDHIKFGVGIELASGQLLVNAMTPGCAAEKSGNVAVGDEIIAVDGVENLNIEQAKQGFLGRQGTYATVTFRRIEGENMRTFKVQLMRGAADYIFLVEALRSLEVQNARLAKDNERLKSGKPEPNSQADQDRIRELLEGNEELYGQDRNRELLEGNEELHGKIRTYKAKLNAAEDEVLRLRGHQDEVSVLTRQIAELQRKLQMSEEEKHKLRADMRAIEEQANSTTFLHGRIKDLEAELAEQKRMYAALRNENMNGGAQKDQVIAQLRTRVQQLEDAANSSNNAMRLLEESRRQEAMARDQLAKTQKHLSGMVANKENRIQVLEGELATAKQTIGVLSARVSERHDHFEQLGEFIPVPQHHHIPITPLPITSMPIQTIPMNASSPFYTSGQQSNILLGASTNLNTSAQKRAPPASPALITPKKL